MKKITWEEMTLEEKIAYLEECAETRKQRFLRDRSADAVNMIEVKISAGERLTIDDFETYTGVKFSHTMTGKMEEILSISTCCLLNPLCVERIQKKIGICAECFANALMLAKQGLCENTCYNYKVLSTIEIPDALIPYIDRDELRIESFGDVGTVTQAVNYVKFAVFNPHCNVTAWTKNPWLYDAAFKHLGITEKVKNFTLILSSQFINKESVIPAKYAWFIDKTFTVYTLEYLKENKLSSCFINCGGRKCKDCQRCYKNANVSEKHIRELLKKDTSKAEKAGFTWLDTGNPIPVIMPTSDYNKLFI